MAADDAQVQQVGGHVIDITKGEWRGCPHEDGGDGTCRYCDATWDPAERVRLVAELERVLAEREASPAASQENR